jgi:hypothetical protein
MTQAIGHSIKLQIIDLVLDPFRYQDALSREVRSGQLEGEIIQQLATVLPVAIAQLDAIGDMYGSLALAGLYDQLTRRETLV